MINAEEQIEHVAALIYERMWLGGRTTASWQRLCAAADETGEQSYSWRTRNHIMSIAREIHVYMQPKGE